MNLVIPEERLPARLSLNPELRMNDDEFYAFCMANPDGRFERTVEGEILIVPPAGYESDDRNAEVIAQLRTWAKRDGRGRGSAASTEFMLPTGAAYSPDAAWVSNTQLDRLTKGQKRKFLPLCPEFVIELLSPSDRLPTAKKKMQEWLRAGAQLGWLIDADKKTVHIYRAGQSEAEVRTGIDRLEGEGPVEGFELDLTGIWAGV